MDSNSTSVSSPNDDNSIFAHTKISETVTRSFPTLYIVVESFINPETLAPVLGGTETYTSALITLATRYESRAFVFQKSMTPLQVEIQTGVFVESWQNVTQLRHRLGELRAHSRGILILYGYPFAPNETELPCLLIQHGVGADGTEDPPDRPKWLVRLADFRRRVLYMQRIRSELHKYSSVSRVLCVDTNFINQMRANHPMFDWSSHLAYVPNFADISPPEVVEAKWNGERKKTVVLFARRFVAQRGIYLWADCVKYLAPRFPDTEFRFVGFGEGQEYVDLLAQQLPNVHVYSKPYEEMQQQHEEAHIEVIPSLWSEGTSLSCIEGMAAGCAMVCSDVGGLGNLILPEYNGIIVPPRADAFIKAVSNLLINPDRIEFLSMKAYDTAKTSFSRIAWENRVIAIFDEITNQPIVPSLSRRQRIIRQ